MNEAHKSTYIVCPGATKMYQDVKQVFWWDGMKNDVIEYISRCLTCPQVKEEHQKPVRLLQQIEIPKLKWERITMNFVTVLPHTPKGYDSIWIIVDRLRKVVNFLLIKTIYSVTKYV